MIAKMIIFILLIFLNTVLIFIYKKWNEKPWIYLLFVPLLFIISTVIFLLFPKLYYTEKDFFLKILLSFMVILGINFIIPISHHIINVIIQFHEENNSENINRNPIKFLIQNKERMKYIFTIIWFVLSLVMLSGNWFGKK